MSSEPRRAPGEDSVRDQLRQEDGLVEGATGEERGGGAEGAPEPPHRMPEPNPYEQEAVRHATEDPPVDGEVVEEGGEPELEPESPEDVLRRERDQYLELAKRSQADFENYKKRATREVAAAGQRAKSGVVSELFPVVDNLERALASAGEQEEHLAGGVRMVHQSLIAVLNRNGIEQFDPAGETFDPGRHEAISMRPDPAAGPGKVLDVVEKGYAQGDSVLRPARVVVSS